MNVLTANAAALILLLASSARAGSTSLIGRWKGYCSPVNQTESRICTYTFKPGGKGSFDCDFFPDLRCEKTSTKNTSIQFDFTSDDSGLTRISFIKGGDFEAQVSLMKIKSNLLTETGVEARKRSKKNSMKGAVGPFYFTRVE